MQRDLAASAGVGKGLDANLGVSDTRALRQILVGRFGRFGRFGNGVLSQPQNFKGERRRAGNSWETPHRSRISTANFCITVHSGEIDYGGISGSDVSPCAAYSQGQQLRDLNMPGRWEHYKLRT